MLSMFLKIIYIVNKFKIDILYSHWVIPSGYITTLVNLLFKKPLIIRIYSAEINPILNKNNVMSIIGKKMIKYSINNSHLVLCNSGPTCESTKKIIKNKIMEVLPDGIDDTIFNINVNEEKIINKYGHDSTLLFSTGRMVERKGFKYLL